MKVYLLSFVLLFAVALQASSNNERPGFKVVELVNKICDIFEQRGKVPGEQTYKAHMLENLKQLYRESQSSQLNEEEFNEKVFSFQMYVEEMRRSSEQDLEQKKLLEEPVTLRVRKNSSEEREKREKRKRKCISAFPAMCRGH